MAGFGRVGVLVVSGALLTGCAGTAAPAPPPTDGGAEQRYAVSTTVLESPDHGPQLCLGGVAESYPPQCGGPDVVGLDWAEVDGEESANGTTWGTYGLVGTWDGGTLTLTEPPGSPESVPRPEGPPETEFSTPCDAPEGGWAVVDETLAGEEHRGAAVNYANEQPDFGAAWLDRDASFAGARPDDVNAGVLTFSFTGDLQPHETELRRRYGGPLCVVEAEHSQAELVELQAAVQDELPGVALGSNADAVRGVVEVMVPVVDDDVLQRIAAVDPDGLVRAHGMLVPVG
jgi:hypothetical protein